MTVSEDLMDHLDNLLNSMGLVDAFSVEVSQVPIESGGGCNPDCTNGCSQGCWSSCSPGNS